MIQLSEFKGTQFEAYKRGDKIMIQYQGECFDLIICKNHLLVYSYNQNIKICTIEKNEYGVWLAVQMFGETILQSQVDIKNIKIF